MKNKLIMAAIAATLMLGGMHTAVRAAAPVAQDEFTINGGFFRTIGFYLNPGSYQLTVSIINDLTSPSSFAYASVRIAPIWVLDVLATAYTAPGQKQASVSSNIFTIDEYRYFSFDTSYASGNENTIVRSTIIDVNAVTPVPGPEAGAGLGALTLGGMALYMKRRRKEAASAA